MHLRANLRLAKHTRLAVPDCTPKAGVTGSNPVGCAIHVIHQTSTADPPGSLADFANTRSDLLVTAMQQATLLFESRQVLAVVA